jgi:hypothetical protein
MPAQTRRKESLTIRWLAGIAITLLIAGLYFTLGHRNYEMLEIVSGKPSNATTVVLALYMFSVPLLIAGWWRVITKKDGYLTIMIASLAFCILVIHYLFL